ncbi:MAG: ABC transporter permease subunit, partial [Chloroflexota bacterium]
MAGSRRSLPSGWVIGGAACLLLVLAPPVLGSNQLNLPTEVLIFAMVAVTYDLIFGITGLISFGHALFMGAGAYATAIAMTTYH